MSEKSSKVVVGLVMKGFVSCFNSDHGNASQEEIQRRVDDEPQRREELANAVASLTPEEACEAYLALRSVETQLPFGERIDVCVGEGRFIRREWVSDWAGRIRLVAKPKEGWRSNPELWEATFRPDRRSSHGGWKAPTRLSSTASWGHWLRLGWGAYEFQDAEGDRAFYVKVLEVARRHPEWREENMFSAHEVVRLAGWVNPYT